MDYTATHTIKKGKYVKMIRNYGTSINELLNNKKRSLLSIIKQQHETIKLTQKKLLNFDIPYFNQTKVCFFNDKKLVLKTEIPELIAKFRELKQDLIALLNTSYHFQHLCTLELILLFEPKTKVYVTQSYLSEKMQNAFKNLENTLEDGQTKQAIKKLLGGNNEK